MPYATKSLGSARSRRDQRPRSGALTANELLALLGRAWPRLLIYPGGLAAFALVWLLVRTPNKEQRTNQPTTDDRRPLRHGSGQATTHDEQVRQPPTSFQFSIFNSQFPVPGSI